MVKTLSSNAGGAGLIPGHGAKTPHASWPKHKQNKHPSPPSTESTAKGQMNDGYYRVFTGDSTLCNKYYCNKFNKDFKNSPHQKKNLKKVKPLVRVVTIGKDGHGADSRQGKGEDLSSLTVLCF